jgi:WD40 repeat protein
MWDISNNSGKCVTASKKCANWISSLVVLHDGTIATDFADGKIRTFNMQTCEILKTMDVFDVGYVALRVSPNGDLIACGNDGMMHVYQ